MAPCSIAPFVTVPSNQPGTFLRLAPIATNPISKQSNPIRYGDNMRYIYAFFLGIWESGSDLTTNFENEINWYDRGRTFAQKIRGIK